MKMNFKNHFNVFVSGTSGVFKGVKLTKKECIQKCIQNIGTISDDHVVTAMSWGDEDETEILLACGSKENRYYKMYNTQVGAFQDSHSCNIGEGKTIGISRYDGTIITAVESGHIKLWKDKEDEEIVIEAGKNVHRMRHSHRQRNIIATGGEENPLKLFDLQNREQIFVAKNVPHDSLELRVPISVKDIGFFNDNQIVTVGKYGHVRLYDPKAQRRPVIHLDIKDESLVNLAVCPQEKQIIVGSGKGRMNLVDLRKPGKILNTYKGSVGGVTSISCSKTNPYVVSVGLDRFLRVHHINTKEEIQRAYLTSKTTCMLLRSEFTLDEKDMEKEETRIATDEEIEASRKENLMKEEDDRDSEYDEMFDNMQTIGEKRKKKKKMTKNDKRSKVLENVDIVSESKHSKLRKSRKG